MKLGFARVDITPDFPVPLAGYYVSRISQGVHDKLYVRVLYFDDTKNGPVVLIQLDLLNLDRICLEKIHKKVQNDLPNVGKNRILVCASHTHSGFGGIFDTEHGINRELIPLLGETNPALVELVVKRCIKGIVEASGNCVETAVRMNRGTIKGLGTNRRRKDIPCDNSLFVMEFCRQDKKKILLYNLSCHPTVMNSENLLISGDFPGIAAGKLEGGAYDMIVFINGSAGDMSTRFTRKANNFDECSRYAAIIIDTLGGLKQREFLPLEKVKLQYHSVSLQKAETPDPQNAGAHLQDALQNLKDLISQKADSATLRKAASLVEGAQISLLKSNSAERDEPACCKTVEAGILQINKVTIICSPFELFSTLALILKKKKQVECFGYANCLEGYLADCDAWDNLDYEALSSDFKHGEGERYIEMVSNLI